MALLSFAANATTSAIDFAVGDFGLASNAPDAGEAFIFTDTALENLQVSDISITAIGAHDDLLDLRFGDTNPPGGAFTGNPVVAEATLPGFAMLAGESRSVFFQNNGLGPVGVQASFNATAPVASIPATASLLLRSRAPASLLAVRRRKRTMAD